MNGPCGPACDQCHRPKPLQVLYNCTAHEWHRGNMGASVTRLLCAPCRASWLDREGRAALRGEKGA